MAILSLAVLTYLANAIWEVALLAAAAAVADRLFRRAPSRYRHMLWSMALVVAALLPLVSLAGSHRSTETLAPAPTASPSRS